VTTSVDPETVERPDEPNAEPDRRFDDEIVGRLHELEKQLARLADEHAEARARDLARMTSLVEQLDSSPFDERLDDLECRFEDELLERLQHVEQALARLADEHDPRRTAELERMAVAIQHLGSLRLAERLAGLERRLEVLTVRVRAGVLSKPRNDSSPPAPSPVVPATGNATTAASVIVGRELVLEATILSVGLSDACPDGIHAALSVTGGVFGSPSRRQTAERVAWGLLDSGTDEFARFVETYGDVHIVGTRRLELGESRPASLVLQQQIDCKTPVDGETVTVGFPDEGTLLSIGTLSRSDPPQAGCPLVIEIPLTAPLVDRRLAGDGEHRHIGVIVPVGGTLILGGLLQQLRWTGPLAGKARTRTRVERRELLVLLKVREAGR